MTTVFVEQPLTLPGSAYDLLDCSFVKPTEKNKKYCRTVTKDRILKAVSPVDRYEDTHELLQYPYFFCWLLAIICCEVNFVVA